LDTSSELCILRWRRRWGFFSIVVTGIAVPVVEFAVITTFPFAMVAPFPIGTKTIVPVVMVPFSFFQPRAGRGISMVTIPFEAMLFPFVTEMTVSVFAFSVISMMFAGTIGRAAVSALLPVLPVRWGLSLHPGILAIRTIRRNGFIIRSCFRSGIVVGSLAFRIYGSVDNMAAGPVCLDEGDAVITAHIGDRTGRIFGGKGGCISGVSQG
jgi:hypothetical protein